MCSTHFQGKTSDSVEGCTSRDEAEATIRYMFTSVLCRSPDPAGFEYWVKQCLTGTEVEDVQAALQQSEEAASYGDSGCTLATAAAYTGTIDGCKLRDEAEAIIKNLYTEVLCRAPDPEGFEYWINQCITETKVEEIRASMQQSEEAKAYGDDGCTTENVLCCDANPKCNDI